MLLVYGNVPSSSRASHRSRASIDWIACFLALSLCISTGEAQEIESVTPNAVRGIQYSLKKAAPEQTVRVLLVHGIGCRHANWSDKLQQQIVSMLGYREVDYSSVTSRELVNRARQVLSIKEDEVHLESLPEATTAAFDERCADLIAGRPIKIRALALPTLLVRNYERASETSQTAATLSFYEVTWSPLVEQLKAERLSYDALGTGRAWYNASVKRTLVNDQFADAVFYLGEGRASVQRVLLETLCRFWRPGNEVPLGHQLDCQIKPGDPVARSNRYVIIAESMGGQIVFDALRSDHIIDVVDDVFSQTDSVFLISNQLPLFDLAYRSPSSKELVAPAPEVFAASTKNWLQACTAGSKEPESARLQSLLQALGQDRQTIRLDGARRQSQAYSMRTLNEASRKVTDTRNDETQAQSKLEGIAQRIQSLVTEIEGLEGRAGTLQTQLSQQTDAHTRASTAAAESAEELRSLESARDKLRLTVASEGVLTDARAAGALLPLLDSVREVAETGAELMESCAKVKKYKPELGGDNERIRASLLKRCQARADLLRSTNAELLAILRIVDLNTVDDGSQRKATEKAVVEANGSLEKFATTQSSETYYVELFGAGAKLDELFIRGPVRRFEQATGAYEVESQQTRQRLTAILRTPAGATVRNTIETALIRKSVQLGELNKAIAAKRPKAEADRENAQRQDRAVRATTAQLEELNSVVATLGRKKKELDAPIAAANKEILQRKAALADAEEKLATAKEEYERPKKDGWAAFYALLQTSNSMLERQQAAELLRIAPAMSEPSCSFAMSAVSELLLKSSSEEPPPQFVSVFDTNDLLGYQLDGRFCTRYRGAQFENARAKWARNILFLYASPRRAHTGYAAHSQTINLLARGGQSIPGTETCSK